MRLFLFLYFIPLLSICQSSGLSQDSLNARITALEQKQAIAQKNINGAADHLRTGGWSLMSGLIANGAGIGLLFIPATGENKVARNTVGAFVISTGFAVDIMGVAYIIKAANALSPNGRVRKRTPHDL